MSLGEDDNLCTPPILISPSLCSTKEVVGPSLLTQIPLVPFELEFDDEPMNSLLDLFRVDNQSFVCLRCDQVVCSIESQILRCKFHLGNTITSTSHSEPQNPTDGSLEVESTIKLDVPSFLHSTAESSRVSTMSMPSLSTFEAPEISHLVNHLCDWCFTPAERVGVKQYQEAKRGRELVCFNLLSCFNSFLICRRKHIAKRHQRWIYGVQMRKKKKFIILFDSSCLFILSILLSNTLTQMAHL
jgi:hypothetical protein